MRKILICSLLLVSTLGAAEAQPARAGISAAVPSDWTLAPPDPDWAGKRLTSPNGQGWLAVYEAAADGNVAGHMRAVASGEGERTTYLRRGQSWIVSSGFKGDRIYYRKAMLACGGTRWHHIAFEYPAAEKRSYDRFVTRASHALAAHRNEGCGSKAAQR